jgi:iron complex outermembrane receptor protein
VYSNANNQHQFPSWTRYDAGVRYVTSIDNKPLTIRASIENLLDKDFWVLSGSFASVSAPRTFVLSASMDF